MKTLLRFIKQWQLRRAREKYAAAKARREAYDKRFPYKNIMWSDDLAMYANACAEEAKLEERVESLMREQI